MATSSSTDSTDGYKNTKAQLSTRGIRNVTSVIPKIPKTLLEAGEAGDEGDLVDLSVAENWLIRDEILAIERDVVENKLGPEVGFNFDSPIAFSVRFARIRISLSIGSPAVIGIPQTSSPFCNLQHINHGPI